MKQRITSSLDLFLLALIDSGVSTAYAFREQAGLSVGATLPALRRLQEYGFVSRGEKLERNKQDLQLTAAGSRELKAAADRFLRDYQKHPPTDTESVLRVCALALAGKKTRAAKRLLLVAAEERATRTNGTPTGKKLDLKGDLSSCYRELLRTCTASALTAESMHLSALIRQLERKHRKRRL